MISRVEGILSDHSVLTPFFEIVRYFKLRNGIVIDMYSIRGAVDWGWDLSLCEG